MLNDINFIENFILLFQGNGFYSVTNFVKSILTVPIVIIIFGFIFLCIVLNILTIFKKVRL